MSTVDNQNYAAIITIELPGMNEPVTVTLSLLPPDLVSLSGGGVKKLQDCSLAELQAFADELEAEMLRRYEAISLRTLAADEGVKLRIKLLDESGTPLAPAPEPTVVHATDTSRLPEDSAPSEEQAEPAGRAGDTALTSTETVAEEEPQPDHEGQEFAAEVQVSKDKMPEAAHATEPMPPVQERTPETSLEEETETRPEPAEGVVPVEEPVVEGLPPAPAPEAVNGYAVIEETTPSEAPGIRIAGLRRPLGHPTKTAVDILVNEPAFRDAQAHALSSMDREVAGMLIGPQPEKQPDGRYIVHISDIIIARHTRMHGASVTYTPESWRYVTDKLLERYPNDEAVIVGWYHTHPGFGIFLSGMDLFIHQNFFTQKWHVALVLDPLARKSGFFCWNRAQTEVQPYDFPWPAWAAHAW